MQRQMGAYSTPDDGRFGQGHDQQSLARLRSREQELLESHWRVFVCSRGHVIEQHRTAGGTAMSVRCPICGSEAANEAPTVTALREYRAQESPLARLSRAFEALSDWAQQRLDAKTWTVRSELQRKAAQLQGQHQSQEQHSADTLKHPFHR